MSNTDIKKQSGQVSLKEEAAVHYAGFWSRLLGFVIDIFMIGLPVTFVIMAIFGYEAMQEANTLSVLQGKSIENEPDPMIAITQVGLSLLIYVGFWYQTGQTPGKKLAMIKVVDAKSFERATLFQLTLRFVAYFISFITLIGFFLPIFLPKKQALHDLISSTSVIYTTDS